MEIYKTVILGKTVHFVIKGEGERLDEDIRNAVFVYPSLYCDFSLEYDEKQLSFDTDIAPGFGLFLSRVRGYPASEYELQTKEGRRIIHLDNLCFYSLVRKCKVLCTNKLREVCGSRIPLSYVRTPKGEIALLLCEDAQGLREEKVCAAIMRLRGEEGYPAAAVGIAECDGDIRIVGKGKDNAPLDAYAYAAVATLLMSFYGASDISFVANEGRIFATGSAVGVRISANNGFVGRMYR